MKFSELRQEDWLALRLYLDTCLLPVTGLTGKESPVEAGDRLEQLRDLLDLLEIPYHGRTVTYPAWHYAEDAEDLKTQLGKVVQGLRGSGFRYVIIVTLMESLAEFREADLVITPANASTVPELIMKLWQ